MEAMGEALGDFLLMDYAFSNVYRTTYAQILVEVDIFKGLPVLIYLNSLIGSWIQCLDYEGIPFQCRKCHKIGHLASRCSSEKSRSKKSPSWWKNVLDDHYTVLKASTIGDSDSSHDTLVAAMNVVLDGSLVSPSLETSFVLPLSADDSSADDSLVEEEFLLPVPSPTLILNVHPSPIGGRTLYHLLHLPLYQTFLLV